nr:MAG TPA: hypothetical protein [Caudoviricetes sp.]DAO17755.1 MAG TPA: hypothetical protein [Caudoviricetes sp.]
MFLLQHLIESMREEPNVKWFCHPTTMPLISIMYFLILFFVTSFLIRINHLLIGSIKCCKSVPKLNKSNSIPLYN